MNDYNVLAKFLTDKYIDRVSGRDFPERIVGEGCYGWDYGRGSK